MKIDIEEVKKINLKEGDILAIRMPENTPVESIQKFVSRLKDFFPNNKCMVYRNDIEFTKITKELEE